ncbi:MAG: hypothetical protein ACYTFY_20180 [Planctomycetota bacterium]|jgi:hypothetical protein
MISRYFIVLTFAVFIQVHLNASESPFKSLAPELLKDPADIYAGHGPVLGTADKGKIRSGLQKGDLIIGLDGYRVYDLMTYDMIRLRKGADQKYLVIMVKRNNEFHEVKVRNFYPVRSGGFYARKVAPETFMDVLLQLEVQVNPKLFNSFNYFGGEAYEKLKVWLKNTPENERDFSWLKDFVTLYTECAFQNWEKVPLEIKKSPIPFFNTLADFSRQIADGFKKDINFIASPKNLSVTPEFYMGFYPFSLPKFPELGDLQFDDKKFLKALKKVKDNPRGEEAKRLAQTFYRSGDFDEPESYIHYVKKALIDNKNQGGWPVRYSPLYKEESRKELIDYIVPRLEKKGSNELLYVYALLGPMLHEENFEKIIELEKILRERSPYLAFMARNTVGWGASYVGKHALSRQLKKHFAGDDFPVGMPKGLSSWIADRSRELTFSKLFTWGTARTRQSKRIALYDALSRKNTLSESEEKIEEDINENDLGLIDSDLADRIVGLARFNTLNSDLKKLTKLIKGGEGTGIYLDAVNQFFYWDKTYKYGKWWFNTPSYYFKPGREKKQYSLVFNILEGLDWKDKDGVVKEVEELYKQSGAPVAALLIADYLDKNEFKEEAEFYRQKTIFYCDRLADRSRSHYLRSKPWRQAVWYRWHIMEILSASPATAKLTLKYGREHIMGRDKLKKPNFDTTYVYMAQASFYLGEITDAVDYLIKSSTAKVDKGFAYFHQGSVYSKTITFQDVLLQEISKHKGLNEELRKKLKESELMDSISDETRKLFGLEPLGNDNAEEEVKDKKQEEKQVPKVKEVEMF